MGKPYSEDLRERVIGAAQDGATIPEIAEQFGVSISSVVRFRRLHRETGSVSPAKLGGYKGYALAAHEELVRELVAEQSDITLAELKAVLATEKVTVGQSSISRFLHHLNLRFKKSLRAAEQDRPDVAAARKALQKQQPRLDPKRLVFIDETSVSTTITRLYGRAPQGERLVQKVPHGNWKTITFIATPRSRHRALRARRTDDRRDVQGLYGTASRSDADEGRHCVHGWSSISRAICCADSRT